MKRHKQLLKETKDRNAIIAEARVIKRTLAPYKSPAKESADQAVKMVMCEARILVENGYRKQLVEAGLVPVLTSLLKMISPNTDKEAEDKSKSVLDSAGKSAIGTLEGIIARNISEMLGADERWAELIGIALSKMDMFDIPRLITDCEFTAGIIFDVAIEYGVKELGKLIGSDGDSGLFDELIVSMLSQIASDADIVKTIKGKIAEFVCDKFDSFVDTVIDSIS